MRLDATRDQSVKPLEIPAGSHLKHGKQRLKPLATHGNAHAAAGCGIPGGRLDWAAKVWRTQRTHAHDAHDAYTADDATCLIWTGRT